MLTTEIERLNGSQNGHLVEIDRLKQEIQQLESTIIKLRGDSDKLRVLSQEIDRLNGIIDGNERELTSWRSKYVEYGTLQTKIEEHMAMFVIMFAEIESLRARMV